jgi:putative DNA primase/helicase
MSVSTQEFWAEEIEKQGNDNLASQVRDAPKEELKQKGYIDALKQSSPECRELLDGLKDDLAANKDDLRFPYEEHRNKDKQQIAQALSDWLIEERMIRPVVIDGSTIFYEYHPHKKVWTELDYEMIEKLPSKYVRSEATVHFYNQFKKSFAAHHQYMNFDDLGLGPEEVLLKDGTIFNIETGEHRPATPDDRAINCLNATYEDDVEPDGIKEFIKDTIDTEEGYKTLQEYLGYVIKYPSTGYEKALLILGYTDTGKSTFIEVLNYFFEYSQTTNMGLPALGMERAFHIGKLKDTVLNLDNDMEDDEVRRQGRVKTIISQQRVMADPKKQDGYSFRPKTRFIMASNSSPDDRGVTEAYYNRFLTLTATERVVEEDKNRSLVDEITTDQNMSWLLNWAIEGANRLDENNLFTLNRSELETKQIWDKFGTTPQKFVSQQVIVDREGGENVPTKDLYEVYKEWCEGEIDDIVSMREFVNIVSDCPGVIKSKVEAYPGGKKRACFRDIKVRDYLV